MRIRQTSVATSAATSFRISSTNHDRKLKRLEECLKLSSCASLTFDSASGLCELFALNFLHKQNAVEANLTTDFYNLKFD